jgi:small conductance mechanosensitive channel
MVGTACFAKQERPTPPAYSTLADLLENEQARQALIENLQTLAAEQTGQLAKSVEIRKIEAFRI